MCSGPAAWPSASAECRAVFTPSLHKTASKPCSTYLCKMYWLFMGWIIYVPYVCINSCQLPKCSQQKAVVLWEGLAGEPPWMQNLSKKSSRELASLAQLLPRLSRKHKEEMGNWWANYYCLLPQKGSARRRLLYNWSLGVSVTLRELGGERVSGAWDYRGMGYARQMVLRARAAALGAGMSVEPIVWEKYSKRYFLTA